MNEEDNGVREAFFLCPTVLFFYTYRISMKIGHDRINHRQMDIEMWWGSQTTIYFLGGENYEYYIGS